MLQFLFVRWILIGMFLLYRFRMFLLLRYLLTLALGLVSSSVVVSAEPTTSKETLLLAKWCYFKLHKVIVDLWFGKYTIFWLSFHLVQSSKWCWFCWGSVGSWTCQWPNATMFHSFEYIHCHHIDSIGSDHKPLLFFFFFMNLLQIQENSVDFILRSFGFLNLVVVALSFKMLGVVIWIRVKVLWNKSTVLNDRDLSELQMGWLFSCSIGTGSWYWISFRWFIGESWGSLETEVSGTLVTPWWQKYQIFSWTC